MGHSHWKPKVGQAGATIFSTAGEEDSLQIDVSDAEAEPGESWMLEFKEGVDESSEMETVLFEIFQMIHQINNHLQVITINTEMMEMMQGTSNRYVGKILDTSNLIRELMDDFRDRRAGEHQRYSGMKKKLSMGVGMDDAVSQSVDQGSSTE